MAFTGKLTITVIEGQGLKNSNWVTKQDPYVTLQYREQKFKTRTCKDGATDPKFNNQPFLFKLNGADYNDIVQLTVYSDQLLLSDICVGVTSVKIGELISKAGSGSIAISLKNKDNFQQENGYLFISCNYDGTGRELTQPMAATSTIQPYDFAPSIYDKTADFREYNPNIANRQYENYKDSDRDDYYGNYRGDNDNFRPMFFEPDFSDNMYSNKNRDNNYNKDKDDYYRNEAERERFEAMKETGRDYDYDENRNFETHGKKKSGNYKGDRRDSSSTD